MLALIRQHLTSFRQNNEQLRLAYWLIEKTGAAQVWACLRYLTARHRHLHDSFHKMFQVATHNTNGAHCNALSLIG